MNDLILDASTVIIGASAAGLAAAACLKKSGVDYILLEQSEQVAVRWRNHYDRLHLHTNRANSGLPYLPMPASYPRYPSRDQVVAYLEAYANKLELEPRFRQQVVTVEPENGGWVTRTQDAAYHSRFVIVATGYARRPYMPSFLGIEQFRGSVLHSSEYRHGAQYAGQSVLVVGFGNSGGEIAIDLFENGAQTALAVRGAVNVIPRDIFGIPVLAISVYSQKLPPPVGDFFFSPLISLLIGDINKLGLRKLPYGPRQQIARDKRIPLIDIGTIKHIREGHIRVFPGISRITETGVIFEDGRELAVDSIIMATGYRPALHDFLPEVARVTDSSGVPLVSGCESPLPGLYFCGFHVAPTGMLREIGKEAQQLARAIASRLAATS